MHKRFSRVAGHEENRELRTQGPSFLCQSVALQSTRQHHVGEKQIDPGVLVLEERERLRGVTCCEHDVAFIGKHTSDESPHRGLILHYQDHL